MRVLAAALLREGRSVRSLNLDIPESLGLGDPLLTRGQGQLYRMTLCSGAVTAVTLDSFVSGRRHP